MSTRMYCDWCDIELPDGPVGGYFIVTISPSYDREQPVQTLCVECKDAIVTVQKARSDVGRTRNASNIRCLECGSPGVCDCIKRRQAVNDAQSRV